MNTIEETVRGPRTEMAILLETEVRYSVSGSEVEQGLEPSLFQAASAAANEVAHDMGVGLKEVWHMSQRLKRHLERNKHRPTATPVRSERSTRRTSVERRSLPQADSSHVAQPEAAGHPHAQLLCQVPEGMTPLWMWDEWNIVEQDRVTKALRVIAFSSDLNVAVSRARQVADSRNC
jgi:hypothetical protein